MADSGVLRAARVVTPAGVTGPAEVVVGDGRVVAVVPARGPVPDVTLCPGFVDLQCNGWADLDVAAARGGDWERFDAWLAAGGVTTWCPTLVTAPLEAYDVRIAAIARARAERVGAPAPGIAGAHLEGPFLGGAPGAHRRDWVVPVDPAFLARHGADLAVVTLAPEAAGAPEAVRALTASGVLVSLGHSTASFEQSVAMADAGARLVTHCFNAMGPLHHRAPGLAGAALGDDRLAVSLIADGIHVHPSVVRTTFRAKGPGRVALVSDAVAWEAMPDARLVDGAPRRRDGTLAGTCLSLARAVANLVRWGVPLDEAVAAAATTPAALVGLGDRGTVAPGRRGDLVALDTDLRPCATWVAGTQVA